MAEWEAHHGPESLTLLAAQVGAESSPNVPDPRVSQHGFGAH